MIKFSEIEFAYHYTSSGEILNSVVLNKNTGQLLFKSDMLAVDEIGEEDLDPEVWIYVPNKYDLDLGQRLVFEFVLDRLLDDYDEVRQMFRKKGAYGRFKRLLASRRLVKDWFNFQSQREEQEFRAWCAENKIDLSD